MTEKKSPAETRHHSPYTLRTQIGRVTWKLCHATFFRYSPRPFYRWRAWLLRLFGANVDSTAKIHPTTLIEQPWNLTIGANTAIGDRAILYALGSIRIGNRVTVSQYAHLCAGTHDYRSIEMPLLRLPIMVEDDVWIAANAFVGPNVKIAEGAILGACGTTMNNLEPWTIYSGNPAVPMQPRHRFKTSTLSP